MLTRPGTHYYFSSGSVAEPAHPSIAPGHPERFEKSVYRQTLSTFRSLAKNLAEARLAPEDVFFMRIYLVPDEQGALDMNGVRRAYHEFFRPTAVERSPTVALVPVAGLALPGLLVEVEWVARFPNARSLMDLPEPRGDRLNPNLYSYAADGAIIANGIAVVCQTPIYVSSGQIASAVDPGVSIAELRIAGNTREQAADTLRRVERELEGVGLSMSDVVFLRAFITPDPEIPWGEGSPFAQWNAAYGAFFNNARNPHRPARTTAMVEGFDIEGLLVEIEVVAAFPNARGPFSASDHSAPNPDVISMELKDSSIAAGKPIARRTPILWSGTFLPSKTDVSAAEQAADVLRQAETLLAEAELAFEDVIALRVYAAVDPATGVLDRPAWDDAYSRFFGTEARPVKPARSVIPVPVLPESGARFAIELMAAGK